MKSQQAPMRYRAFANKSCRFFLRITSTMPCKVYGFFGAGAGAASCNRARPN